MLKETKESIIQELTDQLDGMGVVILSDFTGMDVETATEIRNRFRESSVQYRVVKNTLARRAFDAAGFGDLNEHLSGPNGLILSEEDPVAPAKILVEFEKKWKTPTIKVGWMDSAIMTAADIRKLATLPSRDELLAQIVGGFQAPVAGMARLLTELLRKFVATLDAVAKEKATA